MAVEWEHLVNLSNTADNTAGIPYIWEDSITVPEGGGVLLLHVIGRFQSGTGQVNVVTIGGETADIQRSNNAANPGAWAWREVPQGTYSVSVNFTSANTIQRCAVAALLLTNYASPHPYSKGQFYDGSWALARQVNLRYPSGGGVGFYGLCTQNSSNYIWSDAEQIQNVQVESSTRHIQAVRPDTATDFESTFGQLLERVDWTTNSGSASFVGVVWANDNGEFVPTPNEDSYDFTGMLSPYSSDRWAFKTYSPTDNNSVFNSNLWGGGGSLIDWTCVAWYDANGDYVGNGRCVAVSKRHCLSTTHGQDVGNTLHFMEPDGTLVIRNVVNKVNVGNIGLSGSQIMRFTVYYLDADLPDSITPAPIFCNPQEEDDLIGKPVVRFHQVNNNDGGRISVSTINRTIFINVGSVNGTSFKLLKRSHYIRPVTTPFANYWDPAIGGDSGGPIFLLKGTQLIYFTNFVWGSGFDGIIGEDGSGPSPYWLKNLIDQACKNLDTANTGYMPEWWGYDPNKALRYQTIQNML